jgi:hypothetical protein
MAYELRTTDDRPEVYYSLAEAAEQAAVASSDEFLRLTWHRIAECWRELSQFRERNRLMRPRIP